MPKYSHEFLFLVDKWYSVIYIWTTIDVCSQYLAKNGLYSLDYLLGNDCTVVFQISRKNRLSFGYRMVQESFQFDIPL